MRIDEYLQKRLSLARNFYSLGSNELQLSCRPDQTVKDIPFLTQPKQSSLNLFKNEANLVRSITEQDILRCIVDESV